MVKHLRYLRYVLLHKWFVLLGCIELGVPLRGIVHDLSKFRPSEWFPYVNYFYGKYLYQTESDIPGGLKSLFIFSKTKADAKREFDAAWLKHQNRNSHHWQHWVLMPDDGGIEVLPMPDADRREMLADWRGAGRALGNPDTRGWYQKNRDNMRLHPFTRAWIEQQLGIDADQVTP